MFYPPLTLCGGEKRVIATHLRHCIMSNRWRESQKNLVLRKSDKNLTTQEHKGYFLVRIFFSWCAPLREAVCRLLLIEEVARVQREKLHSNSKKENASQLVTNRIVCGRSPPLFLVVSSVRHGYIRSFRVESSMGSYKRTHTQSQ